MAKTFEQEATEKAMKAVLGGFAKQITPVSTSISTNSYMAVSSAIPIVDKRYNCYKISNISGKLRLYYTETSTVQEISKLANNIFAVQTRNSYYITRVLGANEENVYFAALYEKPCVGYCMKCQKIDFTDTDMKTILWQTTPVVESKFISGLYKIKTQNSIYVCLPPR